MVAHVFVSGFVQNVGYRQFVRKIARQIGLSGWVKNLPDGRVEAFFSGSKENVERIIEHCRKGPFLSEVKDLKIEWINEKKFDSFNISHQLFIDLWIF